MGLNNAPGNNRGREFATALTTAAMVFASPHAIHDPAPQARQIPTTPATPVASPNQAPNNPQTTHSPLPAPVALREKTNRGEMLRSGEKTRPTPDEATKMVGVTQRSVTATLRRGHQGRNMVNGISSVNEWEEEQISQVEGSASGLWQRGHVLTGRINDALTLEGEPAPEVIPTVVYEFLNEVLTEKAGKPGMEDLRVLDLLKASYERDENLTLGEEDIRRLTPLLEYEFNHAMDFAPDDVKEARDIEAVGADDHKAAEIRAEGRVSAIFAEIESIYGEYKRVEGLGLEGIDEELSALMEAIQDMPVDPTREELIAPLKSYLSGNGPKPSRDVRQTAMRAVKEEFIEQSKAAMAELLSHPDAQLPELVDEYEPEVDISKASVVERMAWDSPEGEKLNKRITDETEGTEQDWINAMSANKARLREAVLRCDTVAIGSTVEARKSAVADIKVLIAKIKVVDANLAEFKTARRNLTSKMVISPGFIQRMLKKRQKTGSTNLAAERALRTPMEQGMPDREEWSSGAEKRQMAARYADKSRDLREAAEKAEEAEMAAFLADMIEMYEERSLGVVDIADGEAPRAYMAEQHTGPFGENVGELIEEALEALLVRYPEALVPNPGNGDTSAQVGGGLDLTGVGGAAMKKGNGTPKGASQTFASESGSEQSRV